MTIMPAGDDGLAIFLDCGDLSNIESLDTEQSVALASSAFRKLGIRTDGNLDIEAYMGNGEAMILARIISPPPAVFKFVSFDDVVSACLNIAYSRGTETELIFYENAYYLCIKGYDSSVLRIFGEYALRVESSPLFLRHLHEHGHPLIESNVFSLIDEYFACK